MRGQSEEEVSYIITAPLEMHTDRVSNALTALVATGKGAVEWKERPPRSRQVTADETSVKLIVQPDAGVVPVVQAIRTAKTAIDVCIFRSTALRSSVRLTAAVQRGVRVRRADRQYQPRRRTRLRKLEQRLLAAGVTVTRTADDLLRYHGKYMVADDMLHVFGFNFTKLDIDRAAASPISTRDRRSAAEAAQVV